MRQMGALSHQGKYHGFCQSLKNNGFNLNLNDNENKTNKKIVASLTLSISPKDYSLFAEASSA